MDTKHFEEIIDMTPTTILIGSGCSIQIIQTKDGLCTGLFFVENSAYGNVLCKHLGSLRESDTEHGVASEFVNRVPEEYRHMGFRHEQYDPEAPALGDKSFEIAISRHDVDDGAVEKLSIPNNLESLALLLSQHITNSEGEINKFEIEPIPGPFLLVRVIPDHPMIYLDIDTNEISLSEDADPCRICSARNRKCVLGINNHSDIYKAIIPYCNGSDEAFKLMQSMPELYHFSQAKGSIIEKLKKIKGE